MATILNLTSPQPPKTFSAGTFNAARNAPFRYTFAPGYASTALPRQYCVMLTFSNDDKAALYISNWSGSTRLEVSDTTGGAAMAQAVTFSAVSVLTITVDPVNRTITLSGATTGNGTYPVSGTLASWWPTGQNLRAGGGYAAGYESGGTYTDAEDIPVVPPSGIKLVVLGASISQGFHDGVQTSIYALTGSSGLVARIPGITLAGVTSAGYRSETALANYASLVAPLYDPTKATNALLVFGDLAINDIYGTNGTDGRTAAQTLGYFNGLATAGKATGYKVYSATTTPVAHPQDTTQQAFDALLRASVSFDGCVDVRAATAPGGALQYLLPPGKPQNGNGLYENTGDTHLSDGPYVAPRVSGGYDYLSAFVAPQMRTFLGISSGSRTARKSPRARRGGRRP